MTAEEQVQPIYPVYRQFELVTGGHDKELDALGIMVELLDEVQNGYEIKRMLEYVIARYTYRTPT